MGGIKVIGTFILRFIRIPSTLRCYLFSGVINGESSIPQNWLGNLRELDIVSRLADDFHQKFEAGKDGETTPEWWDKYPGF